MFPNNRLLFSNLKHSVVSISSKLAYRKSQRSLLDIAIYNDICSSLRPKIGKNFTDPGLERLKLQYLDNCRRNLINISIQEADNDIESLKLQHKHLLTNSQNNITRKQYLSLSKLAKSTEIKILSWQKSKHENKLLYINNSVNYQTINISHYRPEKTIKHRDTLLSKSIKRNRKRRLKNKVIRNRNLVEKIDSIIKNGSVVNLTNIPLPNHALLYLSKGSSFVPSVPASKHDIVYDTNEFIRKLHWRTMFNTNTIDNSQNNNIVNRQAVHPKLKLKSNKWPVINNKLLDNVCNKITNLVNSLDITKIKKYNNLSFLEKKGLLWCINMKQTNEIHFSQADKGGAIVLMDPVTVNGVILSELQDPSKYSVLPSDPRANIESELLNICQTNLMNKGLNDTELFYITGHTDKGKSHNPLFSSGKPNPFPLFKLHSISPENLAEKITPPHRLVTSMKYGPTKRSALFVDAILTPVSISYCGNEYLKDTPDFLNKLMEMETKLCSPGVSLFSLDVKALYPNIDPGHIPSAVESALGIITDFSTERTKFLIDIIKFNINNAVTHYRGDWFKSIKGISTGASDSVCLANIYMKWVLINFFTKYPLYKHFIVSVVRFIDDLFGGWVGTLRQFNSFIKQFNSFGKAFGIIFDKEQFGDTVHFLDVLVSNATGVIITDLYTKPTDAHRYLHRRSFHPKHTFSGIPFSQMRRAVVICSNSYLRDIALDNISSYFLECGYKPEILQKTKLRALELNRNELLELHKSPSFKDTNSKPLCFVIPYSLDVMKIKELIASLADDIEQLSGTRKIIFSQKRNHNTSSLLFNKYGFSQKNNILESQRCGTASCDSCQLKFVNNDPIRLSPNFVIKPSRTANCKTCNIIYAAICKLCQDFYFGKSMNKEHIRMNGHRDKFTIEKFVKSALSMHIFTDHPNQVGNSPHDGLFNYNIAILESVNATNLSRRESFYIWSTEADLRHLNRYKVLH